MCTHTHTGVCRSCTNNVCFGFNTSDGTASRSLTPRASADQLATGRQHAGEQVLPVFDVKYCGVLVLIILFVQRGHFHSLSGSGDDVILAGLLQPLPGPEDSQQQAGDEEGGEGAGHDHGRLQGGQVAEQAGDAGHQGVAAAVGKIFGYRKCCVILAALIFRVDCKI